MKPRAGLLTEYSGARLGTIEMNSTKQELDTKPDWLRIPNWEKLAAHSEPNPPWLRLFTHELDDYQLHQLPPADRYSVWALRLLAARCGGVLPNDETWLSARIGAPVNVRLLVAGGWLEYSDLEAATTGETERASRARASRAQRAAVRGDASRADASRAVVRKKSEKERERARENPSDGGLSSIGEMLEAAQLLKSNGTAPKSE